MYDADNSESPTLPRVLPETLFFHLKTYFLFFIYDELDSNILVKYTGKFPEFYILGSISTYPHPSKHFLRLVLKFWVIIRQNQTILNTYLYQLSARFLFAFCASLIRISTTHLFCEVLQVTF